ncbi:F-box protein PP2-A12-like isoform X2 [Pistacia vera]|uniref:F-box protein PP2-A12-like n=1 Tax=Pistacia vera TaxID=55513 RepID=UPI0012631FBC|nr:F-box protein PP2-A12-like [Pistacia vera]XP_031275061.1 F-box protein PP2-A12-like isoform X1 [Pistacia vera]XP_031275062.1 F-box protein PP2-A12-like isoform X2 [Pistacia vera]
MGASFSALFFDPNWSSVSVQAKPGLGDLPESCVASIIAYLDPPEICKLAKLNRAFRGASLADFVWESKLPSNYQTLIEKVLGDLKENMGKREIYARLCGTNTLDGGTKKVWLDKSSGGVCLSISAKGLAITGIDDRRYWNHIPTEESRFASVAYLQQIWWFEVDGEMEFPFPVGTYSVFFRLQLGRTAKRFGRRICNTEHVHGWDRKPVQFQLWTSDGQHASSQCILNESGRWIRYHIGDFVVENANALTKIKFSMTQIDCTHTKGGLCLDSVQIYPRKYTGRLKHF